MLHSTFPRTHHKYLSMPLLGPVADGFDNWLAGNGYTRSSRKHAIQMLRHIDVDLRRRRIDEVAKLTHVIASDSTFGSFMKTAVFKDQSIERLSGVPQI